MRESLIERSILRISWWPLSVGEGAGREKKCIRGTGQKREGCRHSYITSIHTDNELDYKLGLIVLYARWCIACLSAGRRAFWLGIVEFGRCLGLRDRKPRLVFRESSNL